jgi:hypothetical protein
VLENSYRYAPAAILGAVIVLLVWHDRMGGPPASKGNGAPAAAPKQASTAERESQATNAGTVHVSGPVVGVTIGNETLPVQLRPRDWDHVEIPRSPGDALEAMASRASGGDVVAAYSLSELLRQCEEQAFVSEGELELAIARMHATGSVPFRTREGVIDQPTDSALEESIRKTFEFCRGVPPALRAQYFEWLNLAADLGDPYSQVQFAQQLPDRSPEAADYFMRAWRSGDIDAAGWLARIYGSGIQGGGPDPVKSHAYLTVYAELVRADYAVRAVLEDPAARDSIAADNQSLRESASKLDESELADALALAKRILTDNPNCCLLRAH